MQYPQIKVYVNYRTPLVGLKTTGASSMSSKNTIRSNPSSPLNLVHSGASTATLDLQHGSNLIADISGSSRVALSGRVQGNGRVNVSGAAKLAAMACQMQTVEAQAGGTGQAYVNGVEGVHARVGGVGTIYYQGTLLSQHRSGAGSIKAYFPGQSPAEPQYWSSGSSKVTDRNRGLLAIFTALGFFFFF